MWLGGVERQDWAPLPRHWPRASVICHVSPGRASPSCTGSWMVSKKNIILTCSAYLQCATPIFLQAATRITFCPAALSFFFFFHPGQHRYSISMQ